MGLGGVAIATLPSVIFSKLMFSDGLGGGIYINYMKLMNAVYKFHSYLPWNIKQHGYGIIMVKGMFGL